MTEIMTNVPVLSDSTVTMRPSFKTIMQTDANAGTTAMKQIEEKRRLRHMKFPTLSGRVDYDSFQKPGDIAFKKWYDEGEFRSAAPYRDYDNIIDPCSGFVSAGGDIDRNTGINKIESLVQLSSVPHCSVPQEVNSSRPQTTPEKQTPRVQCIERGKSMFWNSQKISDAMKRAEIGGWTSDKDPRLVKTVKLRGTETETKPVPEQSRDNRDLLALKYRFTASTQRMYEEVPLDQIYAPKVEPPTTTLELRPDMISQRYTLKRFPTEVGEWQKVGSAFDDVQTRRGYYKNRPVTFCSPCARTQHIPLYSGCIGAVNMEEVDNVGEPLEPFTVKRVNLPRYSDTAHRPDIPKYTGCTLYQGKYSPMHSDPNNAFMTTTLHTHRQFPILPTINAYKKGSHMSKMVTTVPPQNPYNKIEQEEVEVQ